MIFIYWIKIDYCLRKSLKKLSKLVCKITNKKDNFFFKRFITNFQNIKDSKTFLKSRKSIFFLRISLIKWKIRMKKLRRTKIMNIYCLNLFTIPMIKSWNLKFKFSTTEILGFHQEISPNIEKFSTITKIICFLKKMKFFNKKKILITLHYWHHQN